MSGQWIAGELSFDEKHLLFVALMKKLDLVTFRAITNPEEATLEKNFELLTQLVMWKTNALLPNIKQTQLPGIVIDNNNCDLFRIRVYLKELLDAKNNYQKKYDQNYKLRSTAEMRANEEKLKRLINSSMIRNSGPNKLHYEKGLAIFACQASGILETDHRYQFYIDLFQITEPDIYQIAPKHFHKMLATFELELEAYSREADLRAFKVLEHIRKLVDIADRGPAAYYDIHDVSLSHASEYMAELAKSSMDLTSDLVKPEQSSFRNSYGKVDMIKFMTAMAEWRKAAEYRRLMTEKTNEMKQQYQAATIEETKDAEDYIIDMERETPIDILIDNGIQIVSTDDSDEEESN